MHVMIDVETLGTRPGSVIVSIGAVAFDPKEASTIGTFLAHVDVADAQYRGCTIDADTVGWWLKQSKEAQNSLFACPALQLPRALEGLNDFLTSSKAYRIWAKPPSFDLTLLKAAYDLCVVKPVWSFRDERDLRTLLDVAEVPSDDVPIEGTAHNALDDAKHQAKLAMFALSKLRGRTEASMIESIRHGAVRLSKRFHR